MLAYHITSGVKYSKGKIFLVNWYYWKSFDEYCIPT